MSKFRQLGYAFGIAVLGGVFRGGLTRMAGPRLSRALGGGEARLVMTRSGGLAHLVRQAFADSLDQTFLVAAGLGVVGAVLVFAFVRPRPAGALSARSPEESVAASA